VEKSIVQLVDELPADNITVKVLKALDYIAPGEWTNLVGFDNSIRVITGETDPSIIDRIRDRAVALYHDPQFGYQSAVKLYQTIDKADTAIATAALANKVGEKISFLSFLGNITPKADVTQSIDLALKIAVEIVAFCKLNGLPTINPQEFANSLANNYTDAAFMRMVALVCIDGILPLGPDFVTKIHGILGGTDTNILTQNPVFQAVSSVLPGATPTDKVGFLDRSLTSVQGWTNSFVTKTGITRQSISSSLGSFIQLADDNLDFVAAVLDQTTNYYEHTGIQTVARRVILQAHTLIKAEPVSVSNPPSTVSSDGEYRLGQTIEVWDEEEEDWYQATIEKIKKNEYFVHYEGYGSSDDEWVDAEDIRSRDRGKSDDNGYAVGQKVKIWDDEEEEWYSAIIRESRNHQYFVHYLDYDDSYDEWVDSDDLV
jgi:hypothetical protein